MATFLLCQMFFMKCFCSYKNPKGCERTSQIKQILKKKWLPTYLNTNVCFSLTDNSNEIKVIFKSNLFCCGNIGYFIEKFVSFFRNDQYNSDWGDLSQGQLENLGKRGVKFENTNYRLDCQFCPINWNNCIWDFW